VVRPPSLSGKAEGLIAVEARRLQWTVEEACMLQSSTLSRIAAIVLLGVSMSGCEAIAGIFKAGFAVGAIAVILVVVGIVVLVGKAKG
jgi:hypothetical protein